MKIKGERPRLIMEVSAEELETLSTFLENVDITLLWYNHGCRYEQVDVGFSIRKTIKEFLSGKP